jgi:hypothetical protein
MERLIVGFFIACLFSLVLGSTGCKRLQPVVSQTTTNDRVVTVTETLHDTTLIFQADTASVRAFLECDSLNQVVMRELEIVNGRKVNPEVKFQYGILEIAMPVDSEAIYLSWKERYVQVTDSTKVSKVTVVKEKPPWYTRFLNNGISALIGIILFLVILKFLKPKIQT